jgi:glycosyltransferase involved in cell wall biosynthesis
MVRVTRPMSLTARLATAAPAERRRLVARAQLVVGTLSGRPAPAERSAVFERLEELLSPADPSAVWLALSVLEGELVTAAEVHRAVRAIHLDGVQAALGASLARTISSWFSGQEDEPEVEVASNAVLVDLEHTARSGLATGIQRVARETVRRWARDHDVTLVGWTADSRRMRRLTQEEVALVVRDEPAAPAGPPAGDGAERRVVIVPWESTYLLPELSLERERNERIAAVAQFARCRTGAIGFDCVPITTAETTALGVSEAFALNLAAVRYTDRVSAISGAAATEYRGWRTMLQSRGVAGPEITADLLPAEVPPSSPEALEEARARLTIPDVPMVLCVGTHEPRKNHVALLHAAELVWREGIEFSLVLIGGRAWNDTAFRRALDEARGRNRPVDTPPGISDRLLWAAYRVARCSVFPSLNEGFGLPVAESLACGTPVITSCFGSMAEIATGGGALLVDPRDDHSIADALRAMLTDDERHAQLAAEAAARPRRTWDDYARDVWGTLAG